MAVAKKKYKRVRNPRIRQWIVFGSGILLLLGLILLIPARWTIMLWVVYILGGAAALAFIVFLVFMLVSLLGSIQYWIKHGYWYSPWAMGPWGYGPYGGRAEYDSDRYEERP